MLEVVTQEIRRPLWRITPDGYDPDLADRAYPQALRLIDEERDGPWIEMRRLLGPGTECPGFRATLISFHPTSETGVFHFPQIVAEIPDLVKLVATVRKGKTRSANRILVNQMPTGATLGVHQDLTPVQATVAPLNVPGEVKIYDPVTWLEIGHYAWPIGQIVEFDNGEEQSQRQPHSVINTSLTDERVSVAVV